MAATWLSKTLVPSGVVEHVVCGNFVATCQPGHAQVVLLHAGSNLELLAVGASGAAASVCSQPLQAGDAVVDMRVLPRAARLDTTAVAVRPCPDPDSLLLLTGSGRVTVLRFDEQCNRFVLVQEVLLTGPGTQPRFQPRLMATSPSGRHGVAIAAFQDRIFYLPPASLVASTPPSACAHTHPSASTATAAAGREAGGSPRTTPAAAAGAEAAGGGTTTTTTTAGVPAASGGGAAVAGRYPAVLSNTPVPYIHRRPRGAAAPPPVLTAGPVAGTAPRDLRSATVDALAASDSRFIAGSSFLPLLPEAGFGAIWDLAILEGPGLITAGRTGAGASGGGGNGGGGGNLVELRRRQRREPGDEGAAVVDGGSSGARGVDYFRVAALVHRSSTDSGAAPTAPPPPADLLGVGHLLRAAPPGPAAAGGQAEDAGAAALVRSNARSVARLNERGRGLLVVGTHGTVFLMAALLARHALPPAGSGGGGGTVSAAAATPATAGCSAAYSSAAAAAAAAAALPPPPVLYLEDLMATAATVTLAALGTAYPAAVAARELPRCGGDSSSSSGGDGGGGGIGGSTDDGDDDVFDFCFPDLHFRRAVLSPLGQQPVRGQGAPERAPAAASGHGWAYLRFAETYFGPAAAAPAATAPPGAAAAAAVGAGGVHAADVGMVRVSAGDGDGGGGGTAAAMDLDDDGENYARRGGTSSAAGFGGAYGGGGGGRVDRTAAGEEEDDEGTTDSRAASTRILPRRRPRRLGALHDAFLRYRATESQGAAAATTAAAAGGEGSRHGDSLRDRLAPYSRGGRGGEEAAQEEEAPPPPPPPRFPPHAAPLLQLLNRDRGTRPLNARSLRTMMDPEHLRLVRKRKEGADTVSARAAVDAATAAMAAIAAAALDEQDIHGARPLPPLKQAPPVLGVEQLPFAEPQCKGHICTVAEWLSAPIPPPTLPPPPPPAPPHFSGIARAASPAAAVAAGHAPPPPPPSLPPPASAFTSRVNGSGPDIATAATSRAAAAACAPLPPPQRQLTHGSVAQMARRLLLCSAAGPALCLTVTFPTFSTPPPVPPPVPPASPPPEKHRHGSPVAAAVAAEYGAADDVELLDAAAMGMQPNISVDARDLEHEEEGGDPGGAAEGDVGLPQLPEMRSPPLAQSRWLSSGFTTDTAAAAAAAGTCAAPTAAARATATLIGFARSSSSSLPTSGGAVGAPASSTTIGSSPPEVAKGRRHVAPPPGVSGRAAGISGGRQAAAASWATRGSGGTGNVPGGRRTKTSALPGRGGGLGRWSCGEGGGGGDGPGPRRPGGVKEAAAAAAGVLALRLLGRVPQPRPMVDFVVTEAAGVSGRGRMLQVTGAVLGLEAPGSAHSPPHPAGGTAAPEHKLQVLRGCLAAPVVASVPNQGAIPNGLWSIPLRTAVALCTSGGALGGGSGAPQPPRAAAAAAAAAANSLPAGGSLVVLSYVGGSRALAPVLDTDFAAESNPGGSGASLPYGDVGPADVAPSMCDVTEALQLRHWEPTLAAGLVAESVLVQVGWYDRTELTENCLGYVLCFSLQITPSGVLLVSLDTLANPALAAAAAGAAAASAAAAAATAPSGSSVLPDDVAATGGGGGGGGSSWDAPLARSTTDGGALTERPFQVGFFGQAAEVAEVAAAATAGGGGCSESRCPSISGYSSVAEGMGAMVLASDMLLDDEVQEGVRSTGDNLALYSPDILPPPPPLLPSSAPLPGFGNAAGDTAAVEGLAGLRRMLSMPPPPPPQLLTTAAGSQMSGGPDTGGGGGASAPAEAEVSPGGVGWWSAAAPDITLGSVAPGCVALVRKLDRRITVLGVVQRGSLGGGGGGGDGSAPSRLSRKRPRSTVTVRELGCSPPLDCEPSCCALRALPPPPAQPPPPRAHALHTFRRTPSASSSAFVAAAATAAMTAAAAAAADAVDPGGAAGAAAPAVHWGVGLPPLPPRTGPISSIQLLLLTHGSSGLRCSLLARISTSVPPGLGPSAGPAGPLTASVPESVLFIAPAPIPMAAAAVAAGRTAGGGGGGRLSIANRWGSPGTSEAVFCLVGLRSGGVAAFSYGAPAATSEAALAAAPSHYRASSDGAEDAAACNAGDGSDFDGVEAMENDGPEAAKAQVVHSVAPTAAAEVLRLVWHSPLEQVPLRLTSLAPFRPWQALAVGTAVHLLELTSHSGRLLCSTVLPASGKWAPDCGTSKAANTAPPHPLEAILAVPMHLPAASAATAVATTAAAAVGGEAAGAGFDAFLQRPVRLPPPPPPPGHPGPQELALVVLNDGSWRVLSLQRLSRLGRQPPSVMPLGPPDGVGDGATRGSVGNGVSERRPASLPVPGTAPLGRPRQLLFVPQLLPALSSSSLSPRAVVHDDDRLPAGVSAAPGGGAGRACDGYLILLADDPQGSQLQPHGQSAGSRFIHVLEAASGRLVTSFDVDAAASGFLATCASVWQVRPEAGVSIDVDGGGPGGGVGPPPWERLMGGGGGGSGLLNDDDGGEVDLGEEGVHGGDGGGGGGGEVLMGDAREALPPGHLWQRRLWDQGGGWEAAEHEALQVAELAAAAAAPPAAGGAEEHREAARGAAAADAAAADPFMVEDWELEPLMAGGEAAAAAAALAAAAADANQPQEPPPEQPHMHRWRWQGERAGAPAVAAAFDVEEFLRELDEQRGAAAAAAPAAAGIGADGEGRRGMDMEEPWRRMRHFVGFLGQVPAAARPGGGGSSAATAAAGDNTRRARPAGTPAVLLAVGCSGQGGGEVMVLQMVPALLQLLPRLRGGDGASSAATAATAAAAAAADSPNGSPSLDKLGDDWFTWPVARRRSPLQHWLGRMAGNAAAAAAATAVPPPPPPPLLPAREAVAVANASDGAEEQAPPPPSSAAAAAVRTAAAADDSGGLPTTRVVHLQVVHRLLLARPVTAVCPYDAETLVVAAGRRLLIYALRCGRLHRMGWTPTRNSVTAMSACPARSLLACTDGTTGVMLYTAVHAGYGTGASAMAVGPPIALRLIAADAVHRPVTSLLLLPPPPPQLQPSRSASDASVSNAGGGGVAAAASPSGEPMDTAPGAADGQPDATTATATDAAAAAAAEMDCVVIAATDSSGQLLMLAPGPPSSGLPCRTLVVVAAAQCPDTGLRLRAHLPRPVPRYNQARPFQPGAPALLLAGLSGAVHVVRPCPEAAVPLLVLLERALAGYWAVRHVTGGRHRCIGEAAVEDVDDVAGRWWWWCSHQHHPGVLDGDLLEQLLDLPRPMGLQVLKGVPPGALTAALAAARTGLDALYHRAVAEADSRLQAMTLREDREGGPQQPQQQPQQQQVPAPNGLLLAGRDSELGFGASPAGGEEESLDLVLQVLQEVLLLPP
ncbi:hypothetical protein VOLCADRAFT_97017 [Volvox carteri f. nagariensis]|uniref:Cleavage/polyadenylation specificity factor A subunit N-terminal domain-containing protein n=1 Tax=Volvox carteri f. nagariensis TaxID=3068 RepID=D8UBP0_VOLCA|nr:uncharacterized protein VOLCADRAFT_97017 [Volvox carteri f. nagariensis]EFJ42800.1 hypothetical protein VOLCADRAFT_97017 [Volvox carteri f. nagariensis]|eukprot:XP_002956060.1 hypothetical protein VOLCADRAFT_97017 [Volvox carteri f. nagariensis]